MIKEPSPDLSLVSYYSIRDGKSVIEIANLILSYIDDEIAKATDKNKETLQRVKGNAQQALSLYRHREPIRSTKTYGRNERVLVRYGNSNQVVEKKYKQVEEDLALGYCIIIEK